MGYFYKLGICSESNKELYGVHYTDYQFMPMSITCTILPWDYIVKLMLTTFANSFSVPCLYYPIFKLLELNDMLRLTLVPLCQRWNRNGVISRYFCVSEGVHLLFCMPHRLFIFNFDNAKMVQSGFLIKMLMTLSLQKLQGLMCL